MADITGGAWDKDLPSASSSIALGDNDIRSNQSSVQAGLEAEHYFSDSSASAGIHKLGSARVYSMTSRSQLSNPTGDGDARIGWNSDGNELWVADASNSTWTLVTSNLNTSSVNTWTSQQVFTGGINATTSKITATAGGSLTGTWADLGAVTTVDINGGTVGGVTLDGTISGTPTWASAQAITVSIADQVNITGLGSLTDLTCTGAIETDSLVVNSEATITGALVLSAGMTGAINTASQTTITDIGTQTSADIDGGAIDGTPIGASSAAAGTFTTVAGTTGTFSSTLSAVGNTKLGGTFGVEGRADLDSTLSCAGAVNFDSTLKVDGTSTMAHVVATSFNLDGATIGAILSGTETKDFGNISAGGGLFSTIAVAGAAVGDLVIMSQPQAAFHKGLQCTGYVSGADTVTYTVWNRDASDRNPGSYTYRAVVLQF